EKIDLVVMGTSGLSGLSKIKALGSVSRYVIENTNVPILLIH
ncbi:MAG: universal stress protein, partial [Candidatus Nitrosothermus koennekii]